jgi:hypothetical protein
MGINAWIGKGPLDADEFLYWTRIFYAVCICGIASLIYYLSFVTESISQNTVRFFGFAVIVLGMGTFANKCMWLSNNEVHINLIFGTMLVLYALSCFFVSVHSIIRKWKKVGWDYRKVLLFHMLGVLLLVPPGIYLAFCNIVNPSSPSFAAGKPMYLGFISFGIIALVMFTQRFLAILRDRAATYNKLHLAYQELEEFPVHDIRVC